MLFSPNLYSISVWSKRSGIASHVCVKQVFSLPILGLQHSSGIDRKTWTAILTHFKHGQACLNFINLIYFMYDVGIMITLPPFPFTGKLELSNEINVCQIVINIILVYSLVFLWET